jgi:hypothetical protein
VYFGFINTSLTAALIASGSQLPSAPNWEYRSPECMLVDKHNFPPRALSINDAKRCLHAFVLDRSGVNDVMKITIKVVIYAQHRIDYIA